MADLKSKLKNLPDSSGVYIMRDSLGKIIYIGKARSLKKRVSQYFSSYGVSTEKVAAMMQNVADFNYIITPSEVDALVLENNLIKKHKPYYNILLKDDKSYPFIKINLKSSYPSIEIVRKISQDGAKYFGPYMQGISAKEITELIFSTFPVRSCKLNMDSIPSSHRPCLNYHIGRCSGPCSGAVSAEFYRSHIDKVISFLAGNDKNISEILKEKMLNAAESEEFEFALYYKERIATLDKIVRKQVTYLAKDYNLDVFGVADNGVRSAVSVMIVRAGKLVGSENTLLDNASLNESAVLNEFLSRYYVNSPMCDEIVASVRVESEAALQDYWSDKAGRRINLVTPIKGVRRQLADMADNNARDFLEHKTAEMDRKKDYTLGAQAQLSESLEIKSTLQRIECYDISNISGTDKVASMIVFIDGVKAPKMYRKFKIKTVKGSDDFASLAETITRRFKRLKEGLDESFSEVPELIIIDGGKGQLGASLQAMRSEGYNIPMVGLAKKEEIMVRENAPEVILPRNSLALYLIQRIRDEAHRFAITFHRNLRNKRMRETELAEIPDVGKIRARVLLDHFGNIESVRKATIDELENAQGIGRTIAEKIYNHYRKEETKDEI